MSIKYVGRTNDFVGKTLWEIIGNLKNFGVGRVVVRSMHERYPEKCFYRILRVEALHDEDPRKVRASVEKTFRGRKYEKTIDICSASYKADYKLVPKAEEAVFCKVDKILTEKILPTHIESPPLLAEFIQREMADRGEKVVQKPMLPLTFREGLQNIAHVAKEGEIPNVKLSMGLGIPVSPSLYQNINMIEK